MTPPAPSTASLCPRKRSWRRFSLRALFVIVLGASIFFGWVAYRVRHFHEQAAFTADLRARGFRIDTEPVAQAWFWRSLAGDDAVQVKWADLSAQNPESDRRRGPSVEDLERILAWTNVESLQLYGPTVNDEILARVGAFRELHSLMLPETAVTGAGLRHLEPLKKLAHLTISCYFQDDFCGGESLNDGLVGLFGKSTGFMNIRLLGIPVREDVLREIGTHCHDLKGLSLQKCDISDRGLSHLKPLSGLLSLDLAGNPAVTDRGLEHLNELRTLETLVLSQTSVSEKGVEIFRRMFPATNVVANDLLESRTASELSNPN